MPRDDWARAKSRDRVRRALRDGSATKAFRPKRKRRKPKKARQRPKAFQATESTLPVCTECRSNDDVVGIREFAQNGNPIYRAHCDACNQFLGFVSRQTYDLLEAKYLLKTIEQT